MPLLIVDMKVADSFAIFSIDTLESGSATSKGESCDAKQKKNVMLRDLGFFLSLSTCDKLFS